MNVNVLKAIGVAVIVLLLAVAYNMYSSSVENDFKDISRTETYLYVFALNDADLLSLRAAEPQAFITGRAARS